MNRNFCLVALCAAFFCPLVYSQEKSVFWPAPVIQKLRTSLKTNPWILERTRQAAAPWLKLSDDQLWNLMFPHTITRSMHVWSSGYCPTCKKDVLMAKWLVDPHKYPWKVQCPHCKDLYPKNDFYKYYLSGIDANGTFSYAKADSSLLYNTFNPDPNDPLHKFGVDDGNGYTDGKNTWRFIGFYLIFGQWKQNILPAVNNLADLYTMTGDPNYARKAGIILDRIADLHPYFDLYNQGYNYEKLHFSNGYVSYWQHAGTEVRALALAYDQVRPALSDDQELVDLLSAKAARFSFKNKKQSWSDIKRNIETGILKDPLLHPERIYNNFPLREITIDYIKTILAWPANREEILADCKKWMHQATMVDGISGEKGSYTSLGTNHITGFLYDYSTVDPNFITDMLAQVPALHDAYRFHTETRVLDQYTIKPGDSGPMGKKDDFMLGFPRKLKVGASTYTVMWKLYEATGDPLLVQIMYQQNGNKTDGMPFDILCDDPDAFRRGVQAVIDKVGPEIHLPSINKSGWHLAILRDGKGINRRAAWLDYDSDHKHGHYDGMQIGLYAHGVDMVGDLGYPPVQYDGWGGPKFDWYHHTAAHNTVVVDGKNNHHDGKTDLWADGKLFKAVRATAPGMYENTTKYQRTLATVSMSDSDFYCIDIFRVEGGSDHAKFMQSSFGTLKTSGLDLKPAPAYGHDTITRDFKCDANAAPGWSADWKFEDVYNYLPAGTNLHLKYTDLTKDAVAYTLQSWSAKFGCCDSKEEYWLDRVMTRRQAIASQPLASTFVSVIEPYVAKSAIASIRRLEIPGSRVGDVAIEITMADGRRDYIISVDNECSNPAPPAVAVLPGLEISLSGELAIARLTASGICDYMALCNGNSMKCKDSEIKLDKVSSFTDAQLKNGKLQIISH